MRQIPMLTTVVQTLSSFGSRHRCPHRNFAQLFYSVCTYVRVQLGTVILKTFMKIPCIRD
jgi:hypothetical protein